MKPSKKDKKRKARRRELTRKRPLVEGSLAWYVREYVAAGFSAEKASILAQAHYETATSRKRIDLVSEQLARLQDMHTFAMAIHKQMQGERIQARSNDGLIEVDGDPHLPECALVQAVCWDSVGDAEVPCTCGSVAGQRPKDPLHCDPFDDHPIEPCERCPAWYRAIYKRITPANFIRE